MKTNHLLDFLMKEPYKVAHFVGFDDFQKYPHNNWIKNLLFLDEYEYTLQGHRGSFKTTALSLAVALHIILFPDKNIILVRKTDNDVIDFTKQVKNLLITNVFQDISVGLHGIPVTFTDDNKYIINTNLNQANKGNPQFRAMGMNSSMTGQHADLVITDDIVTLKDRHSLAERRQTKAVYQELHNIVNRGGKIRNLGTPWHENDAFELMSEPDKYDVYDTGLVSEDEVTRLKATMESVLFSANYELKHIADGEKMFSNPRIDDGSNTRKIYDGYAHIDASYGGKDGSAFTIIKRTEDKIYVYGELKQNHIDESLADFEDKRRLYRAGTLYTETNADKGYLARRIKEPTRTYHENMNKHVKISTYLKGNWDKVIFIKDTDPNYIAQVVDYMEGVSHDDAPDSLASLIRETEEVGGIQLFKL